MRLLFITPKIDERHDDLAFASLWAQAFIEAGYEVVVICGEKGETRLTCPIYDLGHIPGESRVRSLLRFQKLICTLSYDRVFVHLGQRWLGAGAWWWKLKGIPAYLWYTHYTNPVSLRLGMTAVKRVFAATKDSLPHYEGDPRKIVTGHGIDTAFWDMPDLPAEKRESATHLLAVHRLSRSKRLELVIKALTHLPNEYTLTHYGRPQDPRNDAGYAEELRTLVETLGLKDRVRFMGAVPMPALREIYPRYQRILNMAPRTIDKTVLEAMYAGLTPIVTRTQAEAIGGIAFPKDDMPESIAAYIRSSPLRTRTELQNIIQERHSLRALIEKMSVYIDPGT